MLLTWYKDGIHTEVLGQAWEVGPHEPYEIQEGQMPGAAIGWEQSQVWTQVGQWVDWE